MARRKADSNTGLTRELADKLIASLQTPMPRRFAATSNGVSPKTFEGWINDGASGIGDDVCVYLARKVYEHEGRDVGETFHDLREVAKGNDRAAETYLRLMYPADFGGTVRTGPDEFSDAERAAKNRAQLLASPPPRMLAEMRQHRWFQLPAKISAKDRAGIESILAKYAPKLLTEPEKASE